MALGVLCLLGERDSSVPRGDRVPNDCKLMSDSGMGKQWEARTFRLDLRLNKREVLCKKRDVSMDRTEEIHVATKVSVWVYEPRDLKRKEKP